MLKGIVFSATCAALAACAGLPSVDAGMSTQELEAKGGKRVAAGELQASISGALISGRTQTGKGGFWDWNLAADGTVTGTYSNQYGAYPQNGKWNVTEDGRFCYQVSGSGGPESGGNVSGCQQWYRLGNELYAAEASFAYKREVVRR